MILADVVGTVVMTVKHPAFDGEKLLACQPLDDKCKPSGAIILAGVSIGSRAVIGAGSVVTRDVPDAVFAAGNPCRVIRAIGE